MEIAAQIANALAVTFENLELGMFHKHVAFLDTYKSTNTSVTSIAPKIAETEAAGKCSVAST